MGHIKKIDYAAVDKDGDYKVILSSCSMADCEKCGETVRTIMTAQRGQIFSEVEAFL